MESLAQVWAIPLLTFVLIVVTAYYAVKTAGILRETSRLADETSRMAEKTAELVEINLRSYKAMVVPDVEFRHYDADKRAPLQSIGISMHNKGQHPVRWVAIRASVDQTENPGIVEEIMQPVEKSVIAHGEEREAIYYDHRRHRIHFFFVEVQDIAGEKHQIAVNWAK